MKKFKPIKLRFTLIGEDEEPILTHYFGEYEPGVIKDAIAYLEDMEMFYYYKEHNKGAGINVSIYTDCYESSETQWSENAGEYIIPGYFIFELDEVSPILQEVYP